MYSLNGSRQPDRSSAPISAASLAALNALNVGSPFVISGAFTAGAGGAADDVTIAALAAIGFPFKVLRARLHPTTAVGGSTCQFFSQAAGAGTALSSAIASAATTTADSTLNTRPTCPAADGVFCRRSDSGVAGQYTLECVKI